MLNFIFQKYIIIFWLLVSIGILDIILTIYIGYKFNFKLPKKSYSSIRIDVKKTKLILEESKNLDPTLRKFIKLLLLLNRLYKVFFIPIIAFWIIIILIVLLQKYLPF